MSNARSRQSSKNLSRKLGSKAEIDSDRYGLKLESTGKLDPLVRDVVDFANLATWHELAALERIQRTAARIEARYRQEGGDPLAAGLKAQVESGLNVAFGAIMARAEERFPSRSDDPAHRRSGDEYRQLPSAKTFRPHPFYVSINGRPLMSYLTGVLLIPSIRKVRKALWRLAVAAKKGQTAVELNLQVPTPRTIFRIQPDGTIKPVVEDRFTDLNNVLVDAISRIPDVRRLRICWLRERRKNNHACGKIFWAQRADRRECSQLHRDLRRKQEDSPQYEERRRRKNQGQKDIRTNREVLELAKAVADIQRDLKTFTQGR